MKRSLFLLALETSAKAIRTGFASVGALVDCGMPGPAVKFADALADAEAEIEVWEVPAECCCAAPATLQPCGHCRFDEHDLCADLETPHVMQDVDETDPGVGREPAPTPGATVDTTGVPAKFIHWFKP